MNVRVEANRVDLDQAAPTGAVCSEYTLFDQKASESRGKQLLFVIGDLRVKKLDTP